MAFQTSILTVRGKIGNIVGMKGKGRWLARERVYEIRNPKSTKQNEQRLKFAVMGKFAGRVKSFVNLTFKNSKKTSFSEFIDVNFENVISGTYPSYELLFNKMLVSKGTLDMVDSPSAVVDSQILSVSWNDNSGTGNALATDKACILVYNSVKGQSINVMDEGTRSSRQATLTLPTSWSGDSVDVWFTMHGTADPNTNLYADSVYLGNFSI